MSTNLTNPLNVIAVAPVAGQKPAGTKGGGFFEAMARAWGEALDRQAQEIEQQSDVIANGDNTPGQVVRLSALSMEMQFLSNSAQSSNSAVGSALETLGRKQ